MWDLIVSVPDHCLSFYLTRWFDVFYSDEFLDMLSPCAVVHKVSTTPYVRYLLKT